MKKKCLINIIVVILGLVFTGCSTNPTYNESVLIDETVTVYFDKRENEFGDSTIVFQDTIPTPNTWEAGPSRAWFATSVFPTNCTLSGGWVDDSPGYAFGTVIMHIETDTCDITKIGETIILRYSYLDGSVILSNP